MKQLTPKQQLKLAAQVGASMAAFYLLAVLSMSI